MQHQTSYYMLHERETAGGHTRQNSRIYTIQDYNGIGIGLESLAVNGFQSLVFILFLRHPHLLECVKAS